MKKNKIIYSINIEDVQSAALQEYGCKLTDGELNIVADQIGNYFDWYEAIALIIGTHIVRCEANEEQL